MFKTAVTAAFVALRRKIYEHVQMIITDVQAVVVADGGPPEAEQAPALAEEMGRQVSCALERVTHVQAVLEALVSS